MRRTVCLLLALCGLCSACAPALDWRELRPPGAANLVLLMPCRATAQQRGITLAGRPLQLVLHVCEAGGRSWALAHGDVGDPAQVGPALAALRAAAAANLGAAAPAALPLAVPGATPQPASARAQLSGQRADGTRLEMETAVFAHGTVVYQASVLGPTVAPADAEVFFASLRFA